jgi:hypothetical protein
MQFDGHGIYRATKRLPAVCKIAQNTGQTESLTLDKLPQIKWRARESFLFGSHPINIQLSLIHQQF